MTTENMSWELGRSIQLTPAREPLAPDQQGVAIAQRHPTGWFIFARHAEGLDREDLADVAEFVAVRTYLLLEHGPQPGVWDVAADGTFRAYCHAQYLDLESVATG